MLKSKTKTLPQSPTDNLSREIRGKFRGKEEQTRILNDIFQLSSNHNDLEIMQLLKIPNSTYYRYKELLYEESKNIWKEMCKESLEYRAIQLKNSLILCIKINQDIATDPNQPAKDRIEASKVMVDAELRMFIMTRDGPQAVVYPAEMKK